MLFLQMDEWEILLWTVKFLCALYHRTCLFVWKIVSVV